MSNFNTYLKLCTGQPYKVFLFWAQINTRLINTVTFSEPNEETVYIKCALSLTSLTDWVHMYSSAGFSPKI